MITNRKKTYKDIVSEVSSKTGKSKREVKLVLQSFISIVKTEVANGSNVKLRGFGTFTAKIQKERRYYDIKNKEIKISKEKKIPSVKFSLAVIKFFCPPSIVQLPIILKPHEIESIPNPRQTKDLRIGFTPVESFISWEAYPIIVMPQKGSLIKLPRQGRATYLS